MAKTGTKPALRGKAKAARKQRTVALVATRKGAWLMHGDATRRKWRVDGPHFLGRTISRLVLDLRDPKHLYFGNSGGGVHESLDGDGQSAQTLSQDHR